MTFLLAAVVVFGAFLVNEVAWASGRESVEYSGAQLLLAFALWWAILYALGRIVRRGYGWLRRARQGVSGSRWGG